MSSDEKEGEWRALVDPRSKKVYYVNMLTRKTTWTNPHGKFFFFFDARRRELTRNGGIYIQHLKRKSGYSTRILKDVIIT